MAKDKSRRKRAAKRGKPLSASVTKHGTLCIELGVDVVAFAAVFNPTTDQGVTDPRERYTVTNKPGFAREVVSALTEEREDGSSLLTDVLDKATEKAIDDGSQYFWSKKDLAKEMAERRAERKAKR